MEEPLKTVVDGVDIFIEVEPVYGSQRTSASDKALDQADKALENAKNTITTMGKTLVQAIRSFDEQITPDEFSLEFGLKFNVEGSAVVAKVGAEATLKITMKYVHKKDKDS